MSWARCASPDQGLPFSRQHDCRVLVSFPLVLWARHKSLDTLRGYCGLDLSKEHADASFL